MENREKELEEMIRSMAEDTGIPASIHPDAVEKKLEAAKRSGGVSVPCRRYHRRISAFFPWQFGHRQYDVRCVIVRRGRRSGSGSKNDCFGGKL